MKELIKKILSLLPFGLTKNQHYDILTKRIIASALQQDSNCIDVGCYKGEILDLILEAAPHGNHFAFEPLPGQYESLQEKYKNNKNCQIFNVALSNIEGEASFNYVVSNPPYSGLLKRDYDRADEVDESIVVKTNKLDDIVPAEVKIDLIKIDVEGAELLVLEGARSILKKYQPIVIFEHGLGASNHYDATPEKVFELFSQANLNIYTLSNFIKRKSPMSCETFKDQYYTKKNYYFVAGK